MSALQLRRLRNLVKASTGADADDDDADADDTGNFHSTMKAPKDSRKSGKQREGASQQVQAKQKEKTEHGQFLATASSIGGPLCEERGESVSGKGLSPNVQQDPVETLAAADGKKKKKRQKKESRCQEAGDNDEVKEEGRGVSERREQRRRGKNKNSTRQKKEREEELLLEEALRQRELDAGRAGGGLQCYVEATMEDGADLLELLSICNVQMLDTRKERIHLFGLTAVEDVGDGKVPQRRADKRPSSLLFADHLNYTPRFRHSVLATPNRYCWPPYDGLGAFLVVKKTGGNGGPLVYYLDNSAPEMHRANVQLALCEAHHGGVDGLIACLADAPYHIPTLILASSVFETMGSVPRAQEVIDVALYHVGVVLSRFPLRQTARRRSLPFAIPANKQLFQILRCGVHQALRKAATRTAWEIAKLLFSLDATDPLGMLLMLDYLALRSKRWGWLLHVYFIVISELDRDVVDSVISADGGNGDDAFSNHTMALAISTLPGFFFSAALAKCSLEREWAAHVDRVEGGRKTSKIVRELTSAQLHAFMNTPPATVMLANAIGRFPTTAVLLADKVGNCFSTSEKIPESWREIMRVHEETIQEDALHVATLWVARNAEMWKTTEPAAFLRRVITEENGIWLSSHSCVAVTAASRRVSNPTPWRHTSLKEEDLMGNTLTAIPVHLLDPEEITEEDMRDAERRAGLQELSPLDQDALLRFQALYGPLSPSTLSPAQQLSRYEEMLELHGNDWGVGQEHGPLHLFFRTFLSWGNQRDVALQDALNVANIPDPVEERNNRLRIEDEVEEEEEWVTEDSWDENEYFLVISDADDDVE